MTAAFIVHVAAVVTMAAALPAFFAVAWRGERARARRYNEEI